MKGIGTRGRQEASPVRAVSMPMVRSVERAMRILDSVYRAAQGRRVAELSEELGLPRRTVRRLLGTLVGANVIERAPDGDTYHRNPVVWLMMACDVPGFEGTRDTVHKIMRALEEETGMRASLATADPQRRVVVKTVWFFPRGALGMRQRPTNSYPVHATGMGLVHLASLDGKELRRWLGGKLARFTRYTVTSRAEVMKEVARVRQRGYAVCRRTFAPDSAVVAVPVRDDRGRTIASVSVGGPAEIFTEDAVRRCLGPLRKAAERVSRLAHAAPRGQQVITGAGRRGRRYEKATPREAGSSDPPVRAVQRAVNLIAALRQKPGPKRLTDLSREVGLHTATVLRLLRTLVALGIAYKDDVQDGYWCHPLAWLGITYDLHSVVPQRATIRSIMESLADSTGMVTLLATADRSRRSCAVVAMAMPESWARAGGEEQGDPALPVSGRDVCLASIQRSARRLVARVVIKPGMGRRFYTPDKAVGPTHATAIGKVLLASMAPKELQMWLQGGLVKATDRTITSRRRLLEELAQVRKQGYAVSMEEALKGLAAVAVPVLGSAGRTVAALGVAAGPRHITPAFILRLAAALGKASTSITALMGRQ